MKTLVEIARENNVGEICSNCDLYNSFGCSNIKGKILCSTRDYLIEQVKRIPIEDVPFNYRRELR